MKNIIPQSVRLIAAAIGGAVIGSLIMLIFAVPALPEFGKWFAPISNQNWLVVTGVFLGPAVAAVGFWFIFRQIKLQQNANNLETLTRLGQAAQFIGLEHDDLETSVKRLSELPADGAAALVKHEHRNPIDWEEFQKAKAINTRRLERDESACKFLTKNDYDKRMALYAEIEKMLDMDAEKLQSTFNILFDWRPSLANNNKLTPVRVNLITQAFKQLDCEKRTEITNKIANMHQEFEKILGKYDHGISNKISRLQGALYT